jgi:hypothetical protein
VWLRNSRGRSSHAGRRGSGQRARNQRPPFSAPVALKQMRRKSNTSGEMGDAPLLSSRTSPATRHGVGELRRRAGIKQYRPSQAV